ncbi:hypothetical protein C8F04DRAFT_1105035 [Mycena alexandri]|uniref:Uncharacterized protein n=1 Tax=Mycena alexandri TaxID=1745969 RepID=A0AAD6SSJ0_9AGAR|nr:hypothetical protein C8F04DRAFT_1105035 [Mycena alexandri]
MVALPQELLDEIVQDIEGPASHTTLKFCALVSRGLRSTSQQRLFKSIDLTPARVDAVASGLSASPHLGTYICDLTIYLNLPDAHAQLATILTLLSGVQRLVMSSSQGWQAWYWSSLPAELRAAILAILASTSLRCLAFTGMGRRIPLPIIRYALASYQQVAILRVTDLADADEDPALSLPLAAGSIDDNTHLTHLLLGYYPPANPGLNSVLLSDQTSQSFRNLRHLELTAHSQNSLHGLEEIAFKNQHSLQHLTVNFDLEVYETGFRLPLLSHLRVLTARAAVGQLRIPTSFFCAISTLSSSTPQLEVLNLIIQGDENSETFAEDHDFSVLDRVLDSLSHLQAVDWTVFCPGVVAFEERVRTVLPRAHAAGILSFSVLSQPLDDPMLLFSEQKKYVWVLH